VSSIQVRRFRRDDRVQLTDLVNAHVAAVIPGVTVSVNAVLNQLEREPGEFIVDPWVAERLTLVAEQRQRIVAAAHLLRYRDDDDVGADFKGAGEIKWLLFWPPEPYWRSDDDPAAELMAASLASLTEWGCDPLYADGSLPAPAVYGVPDQWPHVAAAYERAGFRHVGPVETILVADVADIITGTELPGVTTRRSVGVDGTRLTAVEGSEDAGYIELEIGVGDARQGPPTLADIGNFGVDEAHRGRGIGRWLVGQAAEWLRLGRVDRVIAYSQGDDDPCLGFLQQVGFRELTRTRRGWTRTT
jgi:GNAT superfamily N-acetyltransferase